MSFELHVVRDLGLNVFQVAGCLGFGFKSDGLVVSSSFLPLVSGDLWWIYGFSGS